MTNTSPQREAGDQSAYDLLTIALEPHFGSLAGQWTDELRQAVRHFLLHELPVTVFAWLVDPQTYQRLDSNDSDKDAAVNALLARNRPYDIALAVLNAAVSAVPTLDQLIDERTAWRDEADDRGDAVVWLDAHKPESDKVWNDIAIASNNLMLIPLDDNGSVLPEDLVEVLTPPGLLRAWHIVVGLSPSDLTDNEWQHLVPLFGIRKTRNGTRPYTNHELDAKRRIFNAIRFKAAHPMPWSRLPSRYGAGTSIYQSYHHYRADGLFARLRDGLKDNPDATDLVAWLETIV